MSKRRIRVKPGKAQSMVGFFVGIVFCLIGVFAVIPAAGLFGIFWTVMAGIITASNGMNAFSDRGVASHEIVIEDEGKQEYKVSSDQEPENPDAEEMKEEVERRLAIAKDLYQEGTITKEEYEEKRKEILKEL